MSFLTRMSYGTVGIIPPSGAATLGVLRVGEIKHKPVVATSPNNEMRATTQAAADEGEEIHAQVTATRRYAGSGVAGTPPGDDALLRACQMAPTDITGVAGTTATYVNAASIASLTWSSAPATTIAPGVVVEVSAGKGAGQRRVVTAWDGAAKKATLNAPLAGGDDAPDATSRYDVPAGRLYVAKAAHEERIDIEVWRRNKKTPTKSIRARLSRGMGSYQASYQVGKAAVFSYTFRGILPEKPTETAWVEPVLPVQAAVAAKLLAGQVYFGGVEAGRLYSFKYDHGASIDQAPAAGQAYGFDEADCNEHKSGGQITYEMAALSDDDPLADFLSGVEKHLSIIMGAPGNGLAFAGWATIQQPDEADQKGRSANAVNLRFTRPDDWVSFFAF